MQRRKSLVIDQSGVACVGDKDKLHQLCPVVEEAHFGGNNLTQWEDVRRFYDVCNQKLVY